MRTANQGTHALQILATLCPCLPLLLPLIGGCVTGAVESDDESSLPGDADGGTEAALQNDVTLLPMGATWRYLEGAAPAGWQGLPFADSGWKSGKAELGFGDGDEATVINAGNPRRIAFYFRASFNVTKATNYTAPRVRFVRDDGAVLYLNGTEIARSNMPTGTMTSTTPANGVAGTRAQEQQVWEVSFPASLLRTGTNVLAAEVHQSSSGSSDVSFKGSVVAAETISQCTIGGVTYADGASNPANPCQKCSLSASTTEWSNAATGTACDDGLFCTVSDACNAGQCTGSARSCADNLSCTADSCSEATDSCASSVATGCVISNACIASGTLNAADSCQKCDPSVSTTSWSSVPGCGASTWTCAGTQVYPGAATDLPAIVAAASTNATLCIHAGVYRLSKSIVPKNGQTLRAEPGAVLNGATAVTSWAQSGTVWIATGQLPATPVPAHNTAGGQCEDNVNNPCTIAEQLFRNGTRVRRVLSAGEVVAGTFYQDFSANKIHYAPAAAGEDPNGTLMEVARTQRAIEGGAADVTIDGITVDMFATQGQDGAVRWTGPRWTIKNCELRNNHGAGIADFGSDARILDNHIHHNGELGIAGHAVTGVVVDGNELAYNNQDQFMIFDGEAGGIKYTKASLTISNNFVHHNNSFGIWLDIDCKNVLIENNLSEDNLAAGIHYEISYDGVIRYNTLRRNNLGTGRVHGPDCTSISCGAGLDVSNSSNVDVYGNTLDGNQNGIGLILTTRGSGIYGLWELSNVNVHDNTETIKRGSTGMKANNYATYFTTKNIRFVNNTYYLDSPTAARFTWSSGTTNFTSWQTAGQDTTGKVLLAP